MALADSHPEGLGARPLRASRATAAWRRLRVVVFGLLWLHWLAMTLLVTPGVSILEADVLYEVPLPLAHTMFLWTACYLLAFPVTVWLFARTTIRLSRTAVSSAAVTRLIRPVTLGLYGVQVGFLVLAVARNLG
jgi:hypothetical protein